MLDTLPVPAIIKDKEEGRNFKMVQVFVFFELLLLSRWCYVPYAKASCDNAHSNSCRFGGVSLPDKIAVTKRMDDSMPL